MEHPAIVERVYAAKGNSRLADDLIYDYLPYIKAETSKSIGRLVLEGDDELGIAMLAFYEAIESYSKMRGAFFKYASLLIKRRLIDYYRSNKRYQDQVSLYRETNDEGGMIIDIIPVEQDQYTDLEVREATQAEIAELSYQLNDFGVSLSDVADNCPKQERTLAACQKAVAYAKAHPQLIEQLKRSKKLPISQLAAGAAVERKTLERHRKYILTLLLIYSNGYEIIRGHLKQVFPENERGLSI